PNYQKNPELFGLKYLISYSEGFPTFFDNNAAYDNEMSIYKRSILYNCILKSTSYNTKEYSQSIIYPYQEDILYYASNLHS
ncbi:MAG TPA: hypothetical protein VIR31_07140, partial [Nitrososphaeraceae archaeon]